MPSAQIPLAGQVVYTPVLGSLHWQGKEPVGGKVLPQVLAFQGQGVPSGQSILAADRHLLTHWLVVVSQVSHLVTSHFVTQVPLPSHFWHPVQEIVQTPLTQVSHWLTSHWGLQLP